MESLDSETLKNMITISSPLIKAVVDTFVTPKLVKFKERLSITNDIDLIPTEDHFSDYFERTYKKLSVINTLVFNNSQRLLKDVYLPLTLTSTNNKEVTCKIESFPKSISDEYGNILITDTAGMGKSTLMKKIFIDIIEGGIGIPIIIELRRLSRDKTLINEIQEQLNSLDKSFNSALLFELLVEGGFIIILDGYDEISLVDRDIVTNDVQTFISKSLNNRFFITSRPEKALASFGEFQEFRINPLEKDEAFELLRKYDNQGNLSALLIKKLKETDMANIEEFLINPLLVSLLFTAFEHKQAVPFKKYLFYRQVYDANFESHDLTKGDSYTHNKYCKLEIDDFHRVLRHIGFACFKLQKIEFSKDQLLKLIEESKTFCVGLDFSTSSFLNDLIVTVPLFSKDGVYYRWAHKSLQEYFAAQFIYLDSKGKQDNILAKIYDHPNIEAFINVLDLYYDMDYKTFRNVIERKLLNEYKDYSENNYKNYPESINIDFIIRRKELSFLNHSFIFKAKQINPQQRFDHAKIEAMIANYEADELFDRDRWMGIIMKTGHKGDIYGIHYENVKKSIIYLLVSKHSKLVLRKPYRPKARKFSINIMLSKEYYLYPIVDKINEPWNSNEEFENINHLIENTQFTNGTINHKAALKTLKEIKENIALENKDNFLLDGI